MLYDLLIPVPSKITNSRNSTLDFIKRLYHHNVFTDKSDQSKLGSLIHVKRNQLAYHHTALGLYPREFRVNDN